MDEIYNWKMVLVLEIPPCVGPGALRNGLYCVE